MLVAEARQDDLGPRPLAPQDALGDEILELVDVEPRGIDDVVGHPPDSGEASSARDARPPGSGLRGAIGWGRRVSLKRLARASSAASRKMRRTGARFRMSRRTAGKSARKRGSRMSTTRAARSISTFFRSHRSTKLPMSLAGRLSTQ